MVTHAEIHRPQRDLVTPSPKSPAFQAYRLLHLAFVFLPLLAGLDKIVESFRWAKYLAPLVERILPFGVRPFMLLVGTIEIVAGFIVAFRPRVGGYVVAAWLALIIVNLLVVGGYYDIVLRDAALLVGAFALARLSIDFDER